MKTHLILSILLFSMFGFIGAEDKAKVNVLIKKLGDTNAMTKRRAAEALGALGPRAAPAIKPLMKLLPDDSELLRKAGIEALGRIGAAAIPELIKQLKGRHKTAMPAAGEALSLIGKPSVDPLRKMLTDKKAKKILADRRGNKDYLIETVRVLRRIGPDAAPVVNDLAALLPTAIGGEAALALAGIGPAAKAALPALLKKAKDERFWSHHAIAEALGSIGSADPVPAVNALIEYAKGRQGLTVKEAAKSLAKLGPSAASAAPALAGLMDYNTIDRRHHRIHIEIRHEALDALAAIGPGAVGVAGDIVDRLGSSDGVFIAKAVNALQKIGPEAVPKLEKGLMSRNERIRFTSVSALGGMGPAGLNGLKTATDDKRRAVQIHALEQLGYIGTRALPVLAKALKDPDSEKRLGAVKSLGNIGAPAAETLIQAFSDKEEAIRTEAIARTAAIGKGAFPSLTRALQSGQNSGKVIEALKAVLLIGPEAKPLIPVCKKRMSSADEKVKLQAARTLLAVGDGSADVVSLAVKSLADPDPAVRIETCRVLAVVGTNAAPAVPDLTARLNDKHWEVRTTASKALASMGESGRSAATDLADALVGNRIWYGGVQALGNMGKAAHAAVPKLIEALHKSKDLNVRLRAAQALGAIKPHAPAAIPALIKILGDGNRRLRDLHYICKDALAEIGTPALPKLIEALDHKSGTVRWHTADTLARIGPPAKHAVPKLTKLIMSGQNHAKHWNRNASLALGKIGPAAAPAIPELMKQLKVADKYVYTTVTQARCNAVMALAGIGKPAVSKIPELRALMKKEKDRHVRHAIEKAIQKLDAAIGE